MYLSWRIPAALQRFRDLCFTSKEALEVNPSRGVETGGDRSNSEAATHQSNLIDLVLSPAAQKLRSGFFSLLLLRTDTAHED